MSFFVIDTSVWVAILRTRSDEELAERAQQILRAGQAAWCNVIQLELWAGIGGAKERIKLRDIQATVHDLEISQAVWAKAFQTADMARSRGVTVPAADYLIYACAHVHKAKIWHHDKHFDALAKL